MIFTSKKYLLSMILIIGMAFSLLTLVNQSYAGEKVVKLKISEMFCWGCANGVKQTLQKVKDVKRIKIDLDSSLAYVYAKSGKTLDANKLIAALKKAGYKAQKVN